MQAQSVSCSGLSTRTRAPRVRAPVYQPDYLGTLQSLLTQSFELGISLLTQILYGVVFVFRYLDLFDSRTYTSGTWHSIWNVSFKLFYLISSSYLVFLMMKVFPRTRERERAWKLGLWSVAGSLVLAPISIWLLETDDYNAWFIEVSSTSPNCLNFAA
jgi:hypothetical protein